MSRVPCSHISLSFIVVLAAACTGSNTPYIPGSGGSDSTADDTGPSTGSCDFSEWTLVGEAWVDPLTCMAWGPKTSFMDWFEAVSPTEAIAGGCTSHCDEDGIGYCEDQAAIPDLNGSWALPSIANLEELALRDAPCDDLTGDLWSRDSDDTMNQLAWTADLTQPGMEVLLNKDSGANVRCMMLIQN